MAVLIGLDFDKACALAAEAAQGQVCEAANDNGAGQVVISGHFESIARAKLLSPAYGAKHVIPLSVSAPFHCALMQPAAHAMEAALVGVHLQSPLVPLYANVTAAAVTDPAMIKQQLVNQVTGTVRWRESVEAMIASGVTEFVEFGGRVLGPMIRRLDPDVKNRSVVTMAEVESFAATL